MWVSRMDITTKGREHETPPSAVCEEMEYTQKTRKDELLYLVLISKNKKE